VIPPPVVYGPPPICQKDLQIAELREQLYALKSQHHGDVHAAQEEVAASDNRYRILCDDKNRSEVDSRNVMDKQGGEISVGQHSLADLKRCLDDKTR